MSHWCPGFTFWDRVTLSQGRPSWSWTHNTRSSVSQVLTLQDVPPCLSSIFQ
jgi:hypothetical protein